VPERRVRSERGDAVLVRARGVVFGELQERGARRVSPHERRCGRCPSRRVREAVARRSTAGFAIASRRRRKQLRRSVARRRSFA
jgi:hypothetical protein